MGANKKKHTLKNTEATRAAGLRTSSPNANAGSCIELLLLSHVNPYKKSGVRGHFQPTPVV